MGSKDSSDRRRGRRKHTNVPFMSDCNTPDFLYEPLPFLCSFAFVTPLPCHVWNAFLIFIIELPWGPRKALFGVSLSPTPITSFAMRGIAIVNSPYCSSHVVSLLIQWSLCSASDLGVWCAVCQVSSGGSGAAWGPQGRPVGWMPGLCRVCCEQVQLSLSILFFPPLSWIESRMHQKRHNNMPNEY